ncbi:hypothetical protein NFI96_003751, partial [Prochilodus magdalenae]
MMESSAFNTIVPSRLDIKLRDLGLNSSLCSWILNFLTDRRQVVKLAGIISSPLTLSTGAPQGCVLSPLLYSLYTHDCTARHSSNVIIKFADDTTIVGLISNNNEEAYREEVSFLTHWCRENNLSLNVNKTKELIVDFRTQERVHNPLTINGATVERVSRVILIDITEDITWTEHTTRVVKKAQQRLFFLRWLMRFDMNPQKPKPTVRVYPQRSVYPGDTVNLTCEVGQSTGWRFLFYNGSQSLQPQYTADNDSNTVSVTVSDVGTAEFTCAARRGTYCSQRSDPANITVTARPKATVRVQPADHVFINETVTLTCDIESGAGWMYQWYKDNKAFSDAQRKKNNTFTADRSHSGNYTCKGTQSIEPRYTQTSNSVRLTVSEPCLITLTRVEKLVINFSSSSKDPGQWLSMPYIAAGSGWNETAFRTAYRIRLNLDIRKALAYRVDGLSLEELIALTIRLDQLKQGSTPAFRRPTAARAVPLPLPAAPETRPPPDPQSPPGLTAEEPMQVDSSRFTAGGGALERVHRLLGDKPKPTVRVDPQRSVYTGDTVTLTCEVEQTDGWSFVWYKDSQSLQPQNPADKTPNTISVTVSDAGTAGFTCEARRGAYRTQRSDPAEITVTARPKTTVRVQPAVHVFIGETVTLTCDIEGGGDWQYQWYKDNKALSDARWKKKYIISKADWSHRGVYTCKGIQSTEPRYSQTSDAVRLTVSEKPKPTVRVTSRASVYTGDTVTLTCEVGQSTGWRFLWYKDSQSLQSQNVCRINVTVSRTARFTCEARRGEYYTQRSAPVRITVTVRPKATVRVQPAGHVLTGERVTLTCGIESGGGWQYQWYKDSTALSAAQTGNTYTIDKVDQSDKGVYTCRGTQSTETCCYSKTSDGVTLTVSDTPTVTVRVTSQSSVYTGDTVTLTCEVEQSAGWSFVWYKGSQRLQSQYPADKNPNTISVTVSDAGTAEFTCAARRQEYFAYYKQKPNHTPSYYCTGDSGPAVVTVKERPKSTVRVQPAVHVFIGETVTLTCDIESVDRWQYQWSKSNKALSAARWKKKYIISKADWSHRGVYTCKGTQSTEPRYSQTSAAVTLTVSVKPKPTVRVTSRTSVYTGDTVTLTCEVGQSTGWSFVWYKDSQSLQPQDTADKDPNTISVTVSDAGTAEFTCEAHRGTYSTQRSAPAEITVTARPKPTVKVQPAGHVFIGETVTLTCDIEGGGGWKYKWSKDNNPLSEARETEYIISKADQSHKGVYTCNGTQSTEPSYSQTSDAITLTVSAERPKPELTSSHKGAALIGSPVVLYCKLEPSAGWKFYWSKHTQNPENETKTETPSYTISSVSVSDRGQYWCRAGRGDPVYYTNYSDALWINTTGGSVILESPVHPVPEGDPLTLRCLYRHTNSSNLTAKFYKDGSLLQTQTPGEMTIRTVSKSDEGLYHCKHPERGESPQSWISVRGAPVSGSLFPVLSSLMAVSPYLLVSIILAVKYYRAR